MPQPSPKRPSPKQRSRKTAAQKKESQNQRPQKRASSSTGLTQRDHNTRPEKLAPLIARSGFCSRRDAKALVNAGRVTVNGVIAESPGLVLPEKAEILIDGQALPEQEPTRLWCYHKPCGLVTSHKDPEGRPTVFGALPPELPRVLSVGRLDLNSEGLLLLTNDGQLARHMELPTTGLPRCYRVRVHGRVDPQRLASLSEGITVDGVRYGRIEAALDHQSGANGWITVLLQEGKNREIRKVMEAIGYSVNRLLRISYGPFELGTLAPSAVQEVPWRNFRHLLPSLARNKNIVAGPSQKQQQP